MNKSLAQLRYENENFAVPDPPRIEKVARFVRNYYGCCRGLRVLECGVARGGLADVLAREGAHCYGVDMYVRNVPGVHCVRADLNSGLPRFDGPFDVVFAGELIEHLYDDARFINEVKNNLKPNGLFVITTPNLVFIVDRLRMMFGKMPMGAYRPYHYHIYTVPILVRLFGDTGFKVLKVSSNHILFSRRRHPAGIVFEWLGDLFPTLGFSLIVFATPKVSVPAAQELLIPAEPQASASAPAIQEAVPPAAPEAPIPVTQESQTI